MLTRKLLSVIDNIIVDVFKIICCSESTDSFMVNVTVAQLPGHKVLQPGHVPRLPPPLAPPLLTGASNAGGWAKIAIPGCQIDD